MEQEKKEKKDKTNKTKVIIIVLLVLLALSVLALWKVVVEKGILADDSVEVSVDDNLITPNGSDVSAPSSNSDDTESVTPSDASSGAELSVPNSNGSESKDEESAGSAGSAGSSDSSEPADIVFSNKNSEDAKPFVMNNMFPGDRKTKDYIVQVSYHDSVTVHFKAELHEGSEKLAEVMRICVTMPASGETLYDGLMKDMDESVKYVLTSQNPTTQDLTYEVRVSLSTAVGNEYQNKSLEADFKWWIEESDEDNLDKEPGKLPGILPGIFGDGDDSNSDIDGENTDGEDGQGILGKTGDDSNVVLWALIAVIAVGVCVVINTSRRKNKKDNDNDKKKEDKPNV